MALSGPQKTVMQTVGVVVLMGGLAWASVPFYDWFCRVTGFGGTPGQVSAAKADVLDKTVKVRFDGSLNDGMPWDFKPVVREMEIRIGETGLAFYEAYNPTDKPVAGQAATTSPIPGPSRRSTALLYQQVLAPGERVQVPVSFFVDPEMVEDRDGSLAIPSLCPIHYEIDLPEGYAALDQVSATTTN